jgi:hypothetical protein
LVLKGIITEDDWLEIRDQIQYKYATDAYYTESKEQEILRVRVEILSQVAPFIGSLYSKKYVQKNILMLSENEIDEINEELAFHNDMGEPQMAPDAEQQMNLATHNAMLQGESDDGK